MDVRTRNDDATPSNEFVGNTDLPGAQDDDENPVVTLSEDGDPDGNAIVESDSPHAASEDQVAEETEARTSGWVSRDEWVSSHGSEKGWKPAADFNDFRRNFLPIVQRENRELRNKLAKLENNQNADLNEKQQARVRLERESLKLELKQAFEDQDSDKFAEVSEKLAGLPATGMKATQEANTIDPDVQEQFNDFASQNEWLKKDQDLAADFAVNLKQVIDARIPGMSMEQCLNRAKRTTVAMNPDKFNRRSRPPMADSGGYPGVSRGTNTRSWNDLKPEVRSEYQDMIDNNPGLTRAGILKNCDASHFRN